MLMNNASPPDHADDESRHAAIVAAANDTFQTLTHWLFPTPLQPTAPHEHQSL
jgi:hypothetical protein